MFPFVTNQRKRIKLVYPAMNKLGNRKSNSQCVSRLPTTLHGLPQSPVQVPAICFWLSSHQTLKPRSSNNEVPCYYASSNFQKFKLAAMLPLHMQYLLSVNLSSSLKIPFYPWIPLYPTKHPLHSIHPRGAFPSQNSVQLAIHLVRRTLHLS